MHDTQYIISCLVTLNHVTGIPVKDYSHMWCEASLTGFSHMMLYEQAVNDDNCPEKSGANVLLILGHFQKCLTGDMFKNMHGWEDGGISMEKED